MERRPCHWGGKDGGRRRAPRGTPLRGMGLGGIIGEGGGRPRGTPLRGKGLGGDDGGRGRAPTRDAPTGEGVGGNDGGRRRAPTRDAPTGGGGRGWVPASARTTERDGRFANRPYGGRVWGNDGGWEAWRKERGGKGSGFVVIEGPRWYSAFLKWEEYVRLSYTHFPQRRRFISD